MALACIFWSREQPPDTGSRYHGTKGTSATRRYNSATRHRISTDPVLKGSQVAIHPPSYPYASTESSVIIFAHPKHA